MNLGLKEIEGLSSFLISEEAIRQNISGLCHDTIVLDSNFVIQVVGVDLLKVVEFSESELRGKSIDYLTGGGSIARDLRKMLSKGYFSSTPFEFKTKSLKAVTVHLSGFYLGLISEDNSRIILRLSSKQTISVVPLSERGEIDKFIYWTGHDLRGPLATIKGLMHLIKLKQFDEESSDLLGHLDGLVNILDERLFHIMYLSQEDSEYMEEGSTSVGMIESRLRKIIEKNAFVDFPQFNFISNLGVITDLPQGLTMALLENLLLYVLSLPMKDLKGTIQFELVHQKDHLKIELIADGFSIDGNLEEVLLMPEFEYSDLVRFPQMLNFYAARRCAQKLDAKLCVSLFLPFRQRLEILVPYRNIQQLS